MIFEIVVENEFGSVLRETQYGDAWKLAEMLWSCGFKNYRVACYDDYEDAVEIGKD